MEIAIGHLGPINIIARIKKMPTFHLGSLRNSKIWVISSLPNTLSCTMELRELDLSMSLRMIRVATSSHVDIMRGKVSDYLSLRHSKFLRILRGVELVQHRGRVSQIGLLDIQHPKHSNDINEHFQAEQRAAKRDRIHEKPQRNPKTVAVNTKALTPNVRAPNNNRLTNLNCLNKHPTTNVSYLHCQNKINNIYNKILIN